MRLSCLDFKVFDNLGKYPLGCVIFGHSMYTRTSDISKVAFCNRYGCNHKEPAIKWGRRPQMPKCKPPRNDSASPQSNFRVELDCMIRDSEKQLLETAIRLKSDLKNSSADASDAMNKFNDNDNVFPTDKNKVYGKVNLR